MANIFVGNADKVDKEVLDHLTRLPNDFWVFAEFDVNGRNVDWLIFREVPEGHPPGIHSVVIMTELKRTSAVLDGDENSRWNEQRNGEWSELIPRNMDDVNPWRQLINTVNRFREWFDNNQRRFISTEIGHYDPSTIRVWPNLLILSEPRDLVHRLPYRPQNNYGAFHFDIGRWVSMIEQWTPNLGVRLDARELADLARVLGLRRIEVTAPEPEAEPEPAPAEPVTPVSSPAQPAYLPWLAGFTAWASNLEYRLLVLEQALGISQPTSAQAAPPTPDRPLTQDEITLIRSSLVALRYRGKKCDFPNMFAEMLRQQPGPSFKERNFNGYGSGRAMMDRAVRENVIRYGPADVNGLPTIILVE